MTIRPEMEPQRHLIDFSDAIENGFWEDAEARILSALQQIASQLASSGQVARRLFSMNGIQGFEFIDVVRRRYDVVLMNPPFGAASRGAQQYIENSYPRTKSDLLSAFVERGLELLHTGGFLGAITSRTCFFLSSFQSWREDVLLKETQPIIVADFGDGVLEAMVETAAYVVERTR